ncbi:hypothetical protein AAIR98_001675 [Elusimicrobium simillimum]|uniref:glycogen-binding domain-containing protein n=1 Tax=Elusimicrobium simillimum TaxID=3143438 RepID=UPI003C6EED07
MTKHKEQKPEDKKDNITPMIMSLLLLAACLFGLLLAAQDYHKEVTAVPGEKVEITPLKKTPKPTPVDTEIKFRKFFLTAPGAKKVELLADFNDFGKTPIILTPYNKGYFDTSVALAAGDYKYVFLVDDKEVLDPVNSDIIEFNGRKVNIKTVK